MAANPHILLVMADSQTSKLIERNILGPEKFRVSVSKSCTQGETLITSARPDLMILGDDLEDGHHLEFAAKMLKKQPTLPIILFTKDSSDSMPIQFARLGLVAWLTPPLHPDDVLGAVKRGLQRSQDWNAWLKLEASRYTGPLQQKVDELEALAKVGRSLTSELDLDRVLTTVVEVAVEFTGAEEGSILLLDEESGELYMRAARNFQEEFVSTFRMPAEDTLAGEVLKTGKPAFIDAETPQKIKTAYLVYTLMYVPLAIHGRTIGVLGVDNRQTGTSFEPEHVTFMTAMADYAAIAIDNAQLYSHTEVEREKLETILTKINDGVIGVGPDGTLILINPAARQIFRLGDKDFNGAAVEDVFEHDDLLKILKGEGEKSSRIEIEVEKSRFYNIQTTEIPDFGLVAILHDITYLKELDRSKSDFVNAVSHDLRSPLTAIMGYVELIERLGDVNEQQAEFIKRVQLSVNNITDLIDDLLDLGRIEVNLETQIERVPLSSILNLSLDGLANQIEEKKQNIKLEFKGELPVVIGNPIQLRQMFDNIIGNAIKYTLEGGDIIIKSMEENEQLIIQVLDTGLGIPADEQSQIFNKFFRASNAPREIQGTGLGLAIVKTIVENHHGRIWVDSILGKGSTFTIVIPIAIANNSK
ncbi:MAG: GAF domain-containing protein [Chloroflexi bacterium]|nr:GAF domain-containing protein [Chloroflexota bacterium]